MSPFKFGDIATKKFALLREELLSKLVHLQHPSVLQVLVHLLIREEPHKLQCVPQHKHHEGPHLVVCFFSLGVDVVVTANMDLEIIQLH